MQVVRAVQRLYALGIAHSGFTDELAKNSMVSRALLHSLPDSRQTKNKAISDRNATCTKGRHQRLRYTPLCPDAPLYKRPRTVNRQAASVIPATLSPDFELDGDIIAFSKSSQNLYLLNPSAGLIWRGLKDGLTVSDVSDALAEATGHSKDAILDDCNRLIDDWQRAGLIATPSSARHDATSKDSRHAWWDDTPSGSQSRILAKRTRVSREYRLLDFRFNLRTADSQLDVEVHDLLAHLRCTGSKATDNTVDLCRDDGSWRLYYNGRAVDECMTAESVVPMVHGNLVIAAYKKTDCLLALHAAAVLGEGGNVLLAGVPGSGKSTLTAALMAGGFHYCADDTVVLAGDPLRVRGIRTRLGIKEGSWGVVASLWPGFESLPGYIRADGQRIRYLPAPAQEANEADDPGFLAGVLVFPRFEEGADTLMRPLQRADALVRLTQSGYDVPNELNADIVSAMISWISTLQCFELTYSDVKAAVAMIRNTVS